MTRKAIVSVREERGGTELHQNWGWGGKGRDF